ncbi:hypothetical protein J4558_09330 [Leptolyngbya sp. 15MV]|nr:hypothetical protein J4558_09330 [Leptolyngbya sp. 15MV]
MLDAPTVEVPIPVTEGLAARLADPALRAAAGVLIANWLRPADPERLFQVMNAIAVEAERRGLTDELLEAELAAYNAERRSTPEPS